MVQTKVVGCFSANLFHAELSPERFARYVGGGHLLRCLKALSLIPCSISIEGIDMELYPPLKEFAYNSGKAEVIAGEFSHGFPDWIFNVDPDLALLNFSLGNGVKHPVRFTSEYSTLPELLAKELVKITDEMPAFYAVDSNTDIYSDNWEGKSNPEPVQRLKDGMHSIENGGILYMRMYSKYLNPITGAWFGYQRFRNPSEHGQKTPADLITAIQQQIDIAQEDGVPVIFFPIDIESCVIGSKHGALIYEELCQALADSTLPLVGPGEAYEILKSLAIKTQRPHRKLDRNKWIGHGSQETLKTRMQKMLLSLKGCLPYKGKMAEGIRKQELIAAGSDALVVKKYEIDDKTKLSSDHGDIYFGGENHDAWAIQNAIIRSSERQEPIIEQMETIVTESGSNSLAQLTLDWFIRIGV